MPTLLKGNKVICWQRNIDHSHTEIHHNVSGKTGIKFNRSECECKSLHSVNCPVRQLSSPWIDCKVVGESSGNLLNSAYVYLACQLSSTPCYFCFCVLIRC